MPLGLPDVPSGKYGPLSPGAEPLSLIRAKTEPPRANDGAVPLGTPFPDPGHEHRPDPVPPYPHHPPAGVVAPLEAQIVQVPGRKRQPEAKLTARRLIAWACPEMPGYEGPVHGQTPPGPPPVSGQGLKTLPWPVARSLFPRSLSLRELARRCPVTAFLAGVSGGNSRTSAPVLPALPPLNPSQSTSPLRRPLRARHRQQQG